MSERTGIVLCVGISVILLAAMSLPFVVRTCILADDTGVACSIILKLRFNPW